jgi:hypothetical protein
MKTTRRLRRLSPVLVSVAVLALGVITAPVAAANGARHQHMTAARACQLVARAYGDRNLLRPGAATFDGGTRGDDLVMSNGTSPVPAGEPIPVWCGFAGNDTVSDSWGYVYGGSGNDGIGENWLVFRGGPGNDSVSPNEAYFDGGPGNDYVIANHGTFIGGPGDDRVISKDGPPNAGLFVGGPGNDRVDWNAGTFLGGRGDDYVGVNDGLFDGGPGYDVVVENHGTCVNVEVGC